MEPARIKQKGQSKKLYVHRENGVENPANTEPHGSTWGNVMKTD